ncbi:MAG: 4-hydroxyphenylpyruvate dioxygenase [Candidatus Cloacimonadota bacterium]|nr:MAG: 4-hydroxyphenylpyruvate dioxygenase [Candidatus Cloacimonadota bacterium]
MRNILGIRNYDYLEFYVGSAKVVAYWFARALGMQVTAYKGPETLHRDRCSYLIESENLKIVITGALKPSTSEIYSFLGLHGDGVKRWSVEVDDVQKTFDYAVLHGAVPIIFPTKLEDKNGYVDHSAIKLYDDTELVFINRDNFKGIFMPGFEKPVQKIEISSEDTALKGIDHIVGNVRINQMAQTADYFNNALDFETFIDFGPGDISTKYSALLSKVVRSKDNLIKNPINEPFKGMFKSQIEEFIEQYHGTGVQHIAIETDDILKTIASLRKNGVEFLEIPDTYYDLMREKNPDIVENIDDLQRLGILMDFEGDGYLLQLFTKPIFDRPTFFFEFIQRRGKSEGFGQGNFQALFESIELDQEKRGNLK